MPSLVTAAKIVSSLRHAGFQSYIAGGSVRDMLLGREPVDYDVATAATPDQIRHVFPHTIEVGAAFGVMRVVTDDGTYEVAAFRTEGPYLDGRHPSSVRFASAREDALRRDFTVNGLFYDPETSEILDFVGGRSDLAARRLRTIGDPALRFAEDRLRMLRAVRLAAELGFDIAPETMDALRRLHGGLAEVSPERIRDELVRIVTGRGAARALALLHDTGMLRVVLPEVAAEIGVPQPKAFHPEGDVFEHTRLALGELRSPSAALAMATLLHDIGKPATFEQAPDRIRFNRHDDVGATMARAVMERLRFSRRDVDRVTALVGTHMIFKDLLQMREAKRRRLLADEMFPDLLELHRADCAASHGDLSTYAWASDLLAKQSEEPPPERLITGDDVLDLGLAPGPRVGAILRAVDDARLEGQIRTRDEALALARRLADNPGDRPGDGGV
jgi:poly(A) polymerase